jgi:hypothetical protein
MVAKPKYRFHDQVYRYKLPHDVCAIQIATLLSRNKVIIACPNSADLTGTTIDAMLLTVYGKVLQCCYNHSAQ